MTGLVKRDRRALREMNVQPVRMSSTLRSDEAQTAFAGLTVGEEISRMIDPELLGYLQAMETRLNDGIQQAKDETIASSRAELKPLADLIESLSSEVHDGFARTDARLEAVQVRLDLQGGKLRAGSLWTARLDEWPDKVDNLIAERDKQIADMQNRIAKLEKPLS